MDRLFRVFAVKNRDLFASMTVKQDRLKKIERIAIAAIGAIGAEQPKTAGERLLSGGGSISGAVCDVGLHVELMGDLMVSALQQKSGWKTLTLADVASRPVYREWMKEFQTNTSRRMISGDSICFRSQRLLDGYRIEDVPMEKRRELLRTLGVDALASVLFRAQNKGFSVMGIAMGGVKTKVVTQWAIYDGIDEKPIYFDPSAEGETLPEGTSQLGTREEFSRKTIVAAKTAVDAAMSRLKEKL